MRNLLLAIVAMIAAVWWFQPLCACSSFTGGARGGMLLDLKEIVEKQQAFYAEHGRYTDDLEELEHVPWEALVIDIELVGDSAWIGRAHHVLFLNEETGEPDSNCVTYWGPVDEVPRTIMRERAPDGPGDRICDLTPSRNPIMRRVEVYFPPFSTRRPSR